MPTLELIHRKAFLIHGLLDPVVCERLITWSTQHGYEPATFGKGQRVEGVRNNDRIIEDNMERADMLWQKMRAHMPEDWMTPHAFSRFARGPHIATGLNERFRWYRYTPGQRFAPHVDSVFQRPAPSQEVSMLTALLFLNDGFDGGGTKLWLDGSTHTVTPKTGSLLCFDHGLKHEGVCVDRGTKYILRSDVMYVPTTSEK